MYTPHSLVRKQHPLWDDNFELNVYKTKAKSVITYILSLKTSFSSESIASHFSLKSNERIIRQFTLKQLSSSENRYIIYYGAFTTTTVSRTKMPRNEPAQNEVTDHSRRPPKLEPQTPFPTAASECLPQHFGPNFTHLGSNKTLFQLKDTTERNAIRDRDKIKIELMITKRRCLIWTHAFSDKWCLYSWIQRLLTCSPWNPTSPASPGSPSIPNSPCLPRRPIVPLFPRSPLKYRSISKEWRA